MIRNAPLNALLLLLDPRGRIDPRAFALGLGLLAVLVFLTMMIAGHANEQWNEEGSTLFGASIPLMSMTVLMEPRPTPAYAAALVIAGLRFWCLGCLCLKRLRHAGLPSWPLVAVGLSTATINLSVGFWIKTLIETGQGDLLDFSVFWLLAWVIIGLIWIVSLIWIGLVRRDGAKPVTKKPIPLN